MKTDNKEKWSSIKQAKKTIFSYVIIVIACIFIPLLISANIAYIACTPSRSMCETLNVNDRICVSRLAYIKNEPKTGEIITFISDQVSDTPTLLIKRVIGCPNDVVHIKNGNVYVNGKLLEEEYALKDDYSGDFIVPENSYFVMGDNRAESFDARYWQNHFVDKEDIEGKAIFKFYPKISCLY